MAKGKLLPERHPLPRVTLRRPTDGFDMWHELCRPVMDTAARQTTDDFECDVEFADVGGVVCGRTAYGATRFVRSAEQARSDAGDGWAVHMLTRGEERVDDGKGSYVVRPDRIVLADWRHGYTKDATAADQLSLFIPRHLCPRPDLGGRSAVWWHRDSPAGRVLATAIETTWSTLPDVTVDQASAVGAGLRGLLGGLLDAADGRPANPEHVEPALLDAMIRHLEDHLGNPDVGVEDLVVRFHCSRATTYRLFRSHGGIGRYLRRRRLAVAMDVLNFEPASAINLAGLADRVGFRDSRHFSRAFRDAFGMTPREAAEQHAPARSHPRTSPRRQRPTGGRKEHDHVRRVHGWFGQNPRAAHDR
ncbi:MAG: AraC family transcriptional regulator [Planctomycetota bacterium]